jgi:hypothetical protein
MGIGAFSLSRYKYLKFNYCFGNFITTPRICHTRNSRQSDVVIAGSSLQ